MNDTIYFMTGKHTNNTLKSPSKTLSNMASITSTPVSEDPQPSDEDTQTTHPCCAVSGDKADDLLTELAAQVSKMVVADAVANTVTPLLKGTIVEFLTTHNVVLATGPDLPQTRVVAGKKKDVAKDTKAKGVEKPEAKGVYEVYHSVKGHYTFKYWTDDDHDRNMNYGEKTMDENSDEYDKVLYASKVHAEMVAKLKFKELTAQFFKDRRHGRPPKAKNNAVVDGYRKKIKFSTNDRIELWHQIDVTVLFHEIVDVDQPKTNLVALDDFTMECEYSDSSSGADDDPNEGFEERYDDGYY
jgi:hypothetical protein